MFEIDLENMKASVFVESDLYDTMTSARVGVSRDLLHKGAANYTYEQAKAVVVDIDKALLSCAKHLQKRIRAQRMSFVFAFGPDMEEVCGLPPELR
jgi:hypothetical protein